MNVILISSNITNSGGTERIGIGLANELVRDPDTHVTIISLFGSGKPFFEVHPNITIHTLFHKHVSLFLLLPTVIWKIRKILMTAEEKSVIINIGALLSVFSIVANFGLRHFNLIWEHFNVSLAFTSKKEKFARYMASRYADAVVTLTLKDRAMYLEHFSCRAQIVCIPNFLTFSPQIEAVDQRQVALAVGRLTEQKGFDRLLRVWSQLDDRFKDWQLHIIGDGEDRQKLEQLIVHEQLHHVHLIPTTKNVDHYYREASIYVMTSRWEGLPMVLIEAQSFGLPIISYDCLTGPRDVVSNGTNGFLVEDGNEVGFLAALEKCMDDHDLRASLSSQALKDSKRFDKVQVVQMWRDLFSTLMEQ